MDSGTTHLNSWISYKRNVRGDFSEQFGEDILSIDVVALMTDTDNSGHGDEICAAVAESVSRFSADC